MMRKLRQLQQSESGFTLIELLIVIVILGILAAIVVFAVAGITDRGNAAACKADAKTVEVASEAYYAKYGAYASGIGATAAFNTHDGTLIGEGLIRDTPGNNGYTISYSSSNGKVTASGACTVT